MHQFSRNELAIGKDGLEVMKNTTVAILGVGGVGSFVAETLTRAGIGKIILLDKDTIDITNVNRQIHATIETVGEDKTAMMKKRMLLINPDLEVTIMPIFLTEENYELLFAHDIDYIVDALDTISIKALIIKEAIKRKIPIISSMGMANKMDATKIKIMPLMETKYDPIARVLRKNLRDAKMDRYKIPVVVSEELPTIPREEVLQEIGIQESDIRKQQLPPASNSFVPSVAGILCANYIYLELLKSHNIEVQHK